MGVTEIMIDYFEEFHKNKNVNCNTNKCYKLPDEDNKFESNSSILNKIS